MPKRRRTTAKIIGKLREFEVLVGRGGSPVEAIRAMDCAGIGTAIVNGCHLSGLTAAKLMRDTRMPLDWQVQRQHLGSI